MATRLVTSVVGSYPQPDWLVDRDNLGRAATEQHVGEATGRRTGVECPPPLDRHAEGVQRAEQLVGAPGHPAGLVGVGADDDRRTGIDTGGRLGRGPATDGNPALGDQSHGVLA